MNPVAAQICDTGHTRRHNEDSVATWDPGDAAERARSGYLYVVADGIGSRAGAVASRYVTARLLHDYYAMEESDVAARLTMALKTANNAMFAHNQERPGQMELGATIVAAVVRDDELVVANAGDSRAYVIRAGDPVQITRDHSVVAAMIERGEISEERAANHPWRNRLTRFLGADHEVNVDIFHHRLQIGDTVILCSDGLTRHVNAAEIAAATMLDDPEAASIQLLRLANARGGLDNISIIAVMLRAETGPRSHRSPQRVPPVPDLEALYRSAINGPRWFWQRRNA